VTRPLETILLPKCRTPNTDVSKFTATFQKVARIPPSRRGINIKFGGAMKLKAPGAAHATTLLTVNWFSAICRGISDNHRRFKAGGQ